MKCFEKFELKNDNAEDIRLCGANEAQSLKLNWVSTKLEIYHVIPLDTQLTHPSLTSCLLPCPMTFYQL